MGAIPILLLGDPDLHGFAARQVGRVEHVGPAGSELDVDAEIAAATRAGADFLHPGYGFLSERPALAERCVASGIVFVGPSATTLELCGDKLATREAAVRAGVPVLPASPPVGETPDSWLSAARNIGYPLLVKPAEAGGGRGLRFVADESGLVEAVQASRRESASSGAGAVIYLERAMIEPRHVEVQIASDASGAIVVGDRDCSLQRRHQKVIEEAPAPNFDDQTRTRLHECARLVAEEVGLRGIATCEFLLGSDGELAFLELNPRIQVEHPVTELVTGVDLVEWQLLIASGELLPTRTSAAPRGHAIEARIYAEDPFAGFMPTVGDLATVSWPTGPGIRVDAGYASGDTVPNAYDAMLAKVCAVGHDRRTALETLRVALEDTVVAGVRTNVPWLLNVLYDEDVQSGRATTATVGGITPTMPERSLVPVAAVAYLLDRPDSGTTNAWSAIGPWRMSGPATMTVHGDDWEERITACRTHGSWEARLGRDQTPVRWWTAPDGLITVSSHDTVMKAAVIVRDGALEITGNGGRWLVRLGPQPTAAVTQQRRSGDGRVRAPLPATVLGVHVDMGDRVARGQPLVTLSAMKMELVCDAPADGVVERIGCRVGDLVDAEQELVTIRLGDADTEP
jgi:acetyl-CoA/propionyl-CoA carboxylase, biotin carboxylase, biotin carboxyl carrier protein